MTLQGSEELKLVPTSSIMNTTIDNGIAESQNSIIFIVAFEPAILMTVFFVEISFSLKLTDIFSIVVLIEGITASRILALPKMERLSA